MRSTRRQNERTDQVSYLLLVGAGGQQATSKCTTIGVWGVIVKAGKLAGDWGPTMQMQDG